MRGENQESQTLSRNCCKQWKIELYVDKTTGKLTKVRTPCRLKKLSRWITKTQHSKYSFAPRAHQEVRTKP